MDNSQLIEPEKSVDQSTLLKNLAQLEKKHYRK